jgi:hypothetical protein
MPGVSRFDCYPSDFLNGVIGLTGDEIAAYTIIMMLQYDRGVPVIYVGREHELSVRSGLPKGRLSKAIGNLDRIGKLVCVDGALSIPRTEKELGKISQRIRKNVENSLNGGKTTKKKWEQLRNKINENEGRPAIQPASQNIAPRGPPSSLPPSSQEEKKESKEKKEANGSALDHDFEEFWDKWPNKEAKAAASKAFAKVHLEFTEIMRGVERYIAAKPADRAWMHPATFLNGRRWEDQPAKVVEHDPRSPFPPGTLWSRD